jgi:hypothetical protein
VDDVGGSAAVGAEAGRFLRARVNRREGRGEAGSSKARKRAFQSALHSSGKRGRPHDEVGDQPTDTRMNLLIRAVILQGG